MSAFEIGDHEFAMLRDLIRERFGIYYDDAKRFLLLSRLKTRVAKRGFETYEGYLRFLLSDPRREDEFDALASALSNNETYFFRERAQLRALAGPISDAILEGRSRPTIRIWSAACSSGEEPYSLAITLLEARRIPQAAIEVAASDLSPAVLERARAGRYRPISFRATDPSTIEKYFSRDGDGFIIAPRLRGLVTFSKLNLVEPGAVEGFGRFDAIFCRNCLIYFDRPTQQRVAESFARALAPGGFLFLGHAESLFHLTDRYEPIMQPETIVYRVKR